MYTIFSDNHCYRNGEEVKYKNAHETFLSLEDLENYIRCHYSATSEFTVIRHSDGKEIDVKVICEVKED